MAHSPSAPSINPFPFDYISYSLPSDRRRTGATPLGLRVSMGGGDYYRLSDGSPACLPLDYAIKKTRSIRIKASGYPNHCLKNSEENETGKNVRVQDQGQDQAETRPSPHSCYFVLKWPELGPPTAVRCGSDAAKDCRHHSKDDDSICSPKLEACAPVDRPWAVVAKAMETSDTDGLIWFTVAERMLSAYVSDEFLIRVELKSHPTICVPRTESGTSSF
ncbi:hypothetical protein EVAR_966_1 [Eumeta japonica]|uniref:Uncharacterized protein n=1 Tax=Eumeta variegata TaxID=151549 RepID=A0A4C1SE28_EUMVA|nr:hypothetical protein EVAR_966_1 [Eumeta japonica]